MTVFNKLISEPLTTLILAPFFMLLSFLNKEIYLNDTQTGTITGYVFLAIQIV